MTIEIFGIEHLIYVLVFLAILTAVIILVKKFIKTEKAESVLVKCAGVLLLASILFNRISEAVYYNNILDVLPDTFCSFSSTVMGFGMLIFKKQSKFYHFVCYLAFVGTVAAHIYPTFLPQSDTIWYPPAISSFMHHSTSLICVVILFMTKYFTPTLKKWYCLPLGACCAMTYGIFMITCVGMEDAMQIFTPLVEGTILTWYFTAFLFLIGSYTIMFLFDYAPKWIKIKKAKVES